MFDTEGVMGFLVRAIIMKESDLVWLSSFCLCSAVLRLRDGVGSTLWIFVKLIILVHLNDLLKLWQSIHFSPPSNWSLINNCCCAAVPWNGCNDGTTGIYVLRDVTAWECTDWLLAPYHMPVLAGGAEWIIYGFFSWSNLVFWSW